MTESVVTSVADPSTITPLQFNNTGAQNLIHLELRTRPFSIDREALMELPESILLCLFPNGVVLSQKQQQQQTHHEEEQREVYYVDFDAACLSFILSFYTQARLSYYGTEIRPLEPVQVQSHLPSPLFYRQAIIVLREELEYFAIPSQSDPPLSATDNSLDLTLELKQSCGQILIDQLNIFTALQRNVKRENNVAEQHLIDMLCMSGFTRDDTWGYRSAEPHRCSITSLALVLLKTGITHPPQGTVEMTGPANLARMNPQVDSPQLTTAQKLLLFWRKPARKCWWDATTVDLTLSDQHPRQIKLWARRVWTLELSLVRLSLSS
ncbi:hypothetical protein PSHT_13406 [Puccinia striiformis]|uniref:Phosphatase activator n=1 Tax=Puccinia striiformis TaxID=27350 RepID=A0A2S4UR33_9BASI|nr:hypothetical protein PSHT_13406 [Puccinia striiformis]